MSHELTSRLEVVGVGVRLVTGSFAPNTAAAVTTVKGKGFSIAYTSQGLFTGTLLDKNVISVLSYQHGLQLASAAARWTQAGTTNLTAGTFEVRVIDGSGNVQNVSANANNRVHFSLYLATSSLNS